MSSSANTYSHLGPRASVTASGCGSARLHRCVTLPPALECVSLLQRGHKSNAAAKRQSLAAWKIEASGCDRRRSQWLKSFRPSLDPHADGCATTCRVRLAVVSTPRRTQPPTQTRRIAEEFWEIFECGVFGTDCVEEITSVATDSVRTEGSGVGEQPLSLCHCLLTKLESLVAELRANGEELDQLSVRSKSLHTKNVRGPTLQRCDRQTREVLLQSTTKAVGELLMALPCQTCISGLATWCLGLAGSKEADDSMRGVILEAFTHIATQGIGSLRLSYSADALRRLNSILEALHAAIVHPGINLFSFATAALDGSGTYPVGEAAKFNNTTYQLTTRLIFLLIRHLNTLSLQSLSAAPHVDTPLVNRMFVLSTHVLYALPGLCGTLRGELGDELTLYAGRMEWLHRTSIKAPKEPSLWLGFSAQEEVS